MLETGMTKTLTFLGRSGAYEVIVPIDEPDLEDKALTVIADGIQSVWNVEVDDFQEDGVRRLSGMSGDGSGLWFELKLGGMAELSYWTDRRLVRIDEAVPPAE